MYVKGPTEQHPQKNAGFGSCMYLAGNPTMSFITEGSWDTKLSASEEE